MIVSRLQGGLGNQLFQYAAGRALALRLDTELCLDTSLLDRPKSGMTARAFELGRYRLNFRRLGKAELMRLRIETQVTKLAPLRRWLPSEWPRYYLEPHFQYDAGLAMQRGSVVLQGYWQSPQYFRGIEGELRSALREEYQASEEVRRIVEQISACQSVSLHVRRGDYISNPNTAKFHGVCPVGYYQQATRLIANRVEQPVYFVFSDDPLWVEQNLPFLPRTVRLSSPNCLTHHDELFVMSQCRHHVIANSSFSWWGAWLNPTPEKVVVAPTPWFNDEQIPTRDLIPEEWVVLRRSA